MPTLTIEVPAAYRDDVLRELLALYATSAEALYYAVDDYLRQEASPRSLLVRRSELLAVDQLIAPLGWHLHLPPRRATLVGETALVAGVARRVLGNAIEDMTEALSEGGSGATDIEAVGRALRRVSSLYDLIQSTYRSV